MNDKVLESYLIPEVMDERSFENWLISQEANLLKEESYGLSAMEASGASTNGASPSEYVSKVHTAYNDYKRAKATGDQTKMKAASDEIKQLSDEAKSEEANETNPKKKQTWKKALGIIATIVGIVIGVGLGVSASKKFEAKAEAKRTAQELEEFKDIFRKQGQGIFINSQGLKGSQLKAEIEKIMKQDGVDKVTVVAPSIFEMYKARDEKALSQDFGMDEWMVVSK